MADSFHLPIVFLADNPGMLPGTRSERAGVLRSGARMFAAQTVATTFKLHVTLRKAYGFGSMVMSMLGFDASDRHVRLPRRDDGRDERGGAERGRRTPVTIWRKRCATPSWRRPTGRPRTWASTN